MQQINNAQARLYASTKVSENYSLSLEKQYNNKQKINGDMYIANLLSMRKSNVVKLAMAKFKKQETAEIERSDLEIERELEKLLAPLGLKISDIEFNPTCKICGDSGQTVNGDCECFKKYMFEYITSRLSVSGGEVDLEKSQAVASKYPELEKGYKFAVEYCKRYPNVNKQILFFQGNVGTGKTHLAKGILSSLIAKGASGLFVSAFNMEELFVRHMQNATSFNPNQMVKDEYNLLMNIDVLLVDDLGAEIIHMEKIKPYYVNLLDTRLANGKLTIFTSNLPEKAISEMYGERFFSRLASKKTKCFDIQTAIDLRKLKI